MPRRCTSVGHDFDRGTVQLPLVHGEKAGITCDTGYILKNGSNVECRDGIVDLSYVECKLPTYHFVATKLSWLKSQKHCEDGYHGNLASTRLETFAARRKLALDHDLKADFSIGFKRVSGDYFRVDGSVIEPPLDMKWWPGNPHDHDYMRVRAYPNEYPERIGLLWMYFDEHPMTFFCEN